MCVTSNVACQLRCGRAVGREDLDGAAHELVGERLPILVGQREAPSEDGVGARGRVGEAGHFVHAVGVHVGELVAHVGRDAGRDQRGGGGGVGRHWHI